ncbi:P-loop containing nucleoside triphosphate hydrolase protein [Lineolata rhizophorae]|uniref:P-loop containing nucleoside triphosphate hydrolase protein n=1 Tax=Lineolata rhizophorae TaxID=578093 RepID=A0A6A6NS05_9PEZI|nr:P-loop containing nucleoside triphosphate hydrolase protein [Lineolata rhizophorae]
MATSFTTLPVRQLSAPQPPFLSSNCSPPSRASPLLYSFPAVQMFIIPQTLLILPESLTANGRRHSKAAKGTPLSIDDLPTLDHFTRAADTFASFQKVKRNEHLAKLIARAHVLIFVRHYTLTVLQAITQISPQFAMYKLLKLLEMRAQGKSVTVEAALWAAAMGILAVLDNWLENWMWWVGYGQICVPVRVQLSALIFNKSMRTKDFKGVQKDRKKSDAKGEAEEDRDKDKKEEESTNEDPDIQKTRQGTINLVGVDTKRVSETLIYSNLVFGAIIKLVICFVFIGKLIGWEGLLAGIIVQVLGLPLNIYASKAYTVAQEKLMAVRDKKLAILNEALGGIRQIKFSALEDQWNDKIQDVRRQELKVLWRAFLMDTVLIFIYIMGPVLLSAAALGTYAIIHGSLSASVAFTTIGILTQIEGTLAFVPEIVTNIFDAWVSLNRINGYLNRPDQVVVTAPGEVVAFKGAHISWPSDTTPDEDTFVLRDVNLEFPPNELTVISGHTGSGKSLLLASLLGEVEVLSGSVIVPPNPSMNERYDSKANKDNWILPSALAFVSQQPWIENGSLKDNVTFGLPVDKQRYEQVVHACALDKDLSILPDGDSTEIGANGINLSGGQRWRVTLARALYSRAGILVLDDIFSAVDAHVGRHIFEHALTGPLSEGRTRVLVTHHVSLCLPKTKYEVQLENGTVKHAGFVDDLQRTGKLNNILEEEQLEVAVSDDDEEAETLLAGSSSDPSTQDGTPERRESHSSGLLKVRTDESSTTRKSRQRRQSALSSRSEIVDDGTGLEAGNKQPKDAKKFVEEETKEVGYVKWSVYSEYMKASGGWLFWVFVIVCFAGYQALLLGRTWVLTLWTEAASTESESKAHYSNVYQTVVSAPAQALKNSKGDLNYYLGLYLGFSVIICIEGAFRYFVVMCGAILASRRVFEKLTYRVLRAPLRWLDTVPVGRVLNRFTADFNVIDSTMAMSVAFGLYNFLMVLGIFVASVVVSPYIIILAVILFAICIRYAIYYIWGARETKRLESIAKSPMFELFGSTLSGVGTIRAFAKTEAYIKRMYSLIDAHGRATYYMWLMNRYLSWRLGVVGALFSAAVAILVVFVKTIDASLAGFALSFTLQYTMALIWALRQWAAVELAMNSMERIVEYSEIAIEDQSGIDAPASWPSQGRLEFNDLVVGYAIDLPPVLKGLTFSVDSNERIGVVGRTGAGKSSLTLALFRFLQAREGSISIDGLDISKVKLKDLRSRLAIIPQDPVLFSGTVRSNLDPFNDHDDQELRDALERVHLVRTSRDEEAGEDSADGPSTGATTPTMTSPGAAKNTNIFASLRSAISEGGLNLSQGQRQLLCLARAIVSRPKLMVLDEATSAVDKATDELIQRSIREEFVNSTLLVIAHRLSTIVDFDRILVMSEGKVVEFDTPWKLLETGGVFAGMVADSGEADTLREIILNGR